MAIYAIIGGQWGDEGKGKVVDLLSSEVDVVARYQGGANAGHTVYKNGEKIVLHQIPSGVMRPNCKCLLGNGMVIDPIELVEEFENVKSKGLEVKNVFISMNAHITSPIHKLIDINLEEKSNNQDIFRSYILIEWDEGAANKRLLDKIKADEQLFNAMRASELFNEMEAKVEKYRERNEN